MDKFKVIIKAYPLVRGVLSYGMIWPTSAMAQQVMAGKTWDSFDWKKCLRFSIYGALVVAPSLYAWIKISTAMWPKTSLKTGICKALVEQISYTPMAMIIFYYSMTFLETNSAAAASAEVRTKFLPTYKVALCIWPLIATVNFSLIPERNRVPFISVCSLMWTIFLAYMKQLDQKEEMAILL